MYAANTYHIHEATNEDTATLRRLAAQAADWPLPGRVLIGEVDGVGAAALSLSDGRVHADPGSRIDHLIANLRVRATSMRAYEANPSVDQRMLAGLPAWYQAVATPRPTTEQASADRDADRDAEVAQ